MDEILTPKPEETIEKESSNGLPLINILLSVVIIGLGIYGYMYGNFDGISKKELSNNYLEKSSVSFENISYEQKQNYVPKDTYLNEIEKLKNQEPKIIEKIIEKIVEVEKVVYKDKIIQAEPKIIEKIIETDPKIVEVEKVVYKDKIIKTAPQIIENTIYKDRVIDKTNFDTFRCYGMSPSGYRLNSKCVFGLKSFLKKNSGAKYFEIIAVMNPKDFRTLMILEEKAKLLEEIDLTKDQVIQFKELSTVGLDKLRVVETLWEVQKILGKKAIVVPVSYNVISPLHRGTVIRAYK